MANENAKWYLVQVISNYELKVKEQLENREMADGDEIEEIFVPMKTVISEKTGKARQKPLFPGYIFVKVEMTDDSWFIIRNTQYVTGIVGSSGQRTKPTPIPQEEIVRMIERQQGQAANPAAPVNFEIGEYVKVESGAFAGAAGPITQIKQDKGLIYIESEMLGKKTEIPVSVLDVKKQ